MRKSSEKASLDKNTEHNHRATLFGLPTEILLKIFRYVPSADAARAGRACKASYAIAHTSPVKEKIQLERAARTTQVAAYGDSTFIWRNFSGSFVLAAAGNNQFDQLGSSYTLNIKVFTRIRLPESFVKIIQVAMGEGHTVVYGLDSKGNPLLATAGQNRHGQRGNGKVMSEQLLRVKSQQFSGYYGGVKPTHFVDPFYLIRLPKNLVKISQIAPIACHTIVYGEDAVGNPVFAATGRNDHGQLGTADHEEQKVLKIAQFPVKFAKILQVGAGIRQTLISGVNDEGRLLLIACGQNSWGQLGTGDDTERSIFTQVQLPLEFDSVNQVIAGEDYSMVLGEDADGQPMLASCGNNRNGQLGTGDNLNRNTLTLLNLPQAFVRISKVVVGDKCTAVVGRDFKGRPLLAACGSNNDHQFGVADSHGGNVFTLVELPLELMRVDQIIVGNGFSLIYGTDAEGAPLFAAAGANHYGQLGTGNTEPKNTYTLIELPKSFWKVIHVNAGDNHVLVYGMDVEGIPLIATCGQNNSGQLGTGDIENRNRFALIPLPECLQPQFHVLSENEKEQHEGDAPEESFARHNF